MAKGHRATDNSAEEVRRLRHEDVDAAADTTTARSAADALHVAARAGEPGRSSRVVQLEGSEPELPPLNRPDQRSPAGQLT